MKRVVLLSYKRGSRSVKNLQQWMKDNGYPRLKRTLNPRINRCVINWGNSVAYPYQSIFINNPLSVYNACNKLVSFNFFADADVPTPDWTTSTQLAQQWITDGHVVFGRKLLRSHSGRGIIVLENATITPETRCQLYVKYKKKKREYRVHVFDGKVIDVQQKKKRKDADIISTTIRNFDNGWVYCREGVELPDDAGEIAVKAVSCLGLVFGAVDIIWNERDNKSYVLEVNTAPGLCGSTVEVYGKAIKEYINAKNS